MHKCCLKFDIQFNCFLCLFKLLCLFEILCLFELSFNLDFSNFLHGNLFLRLTAFVCFFSFFFRLNFRWWWSGPWKWRERKRRSTVFSLRINTNCLERLSRILCQFSLIIIDFKFTSFHFPTILYIYFGVLVKNQWTKI